MNIAAIVQKVAFQKLIFNILKNYSKLHDYLLGPEKIEIKTEMLSNYQLKVAIRLLYFYW